MGRTGRAPFSPFALCKVLQQPHSRCKGGERRHPGGHRQSPQGRADGSPRAPAHPCVASRSATLAPATPAPALARSAGSGHVWERPVSRTAVFRAKEGTVGRSCPSPGVFPAQTLPFWEAFHPSVPAKVPGTGAALSARRQGEPPRPFPSQLPSPPADPFLFFLPPPSLPISSLSPPPLCIYIPCIYPRVIYFFPWQLYNPFPCLTAIK